MVREDGTPRIAGGKTGTGDERFERVGRRGHVIESRFVSRAATFVFRLEDRFFGVVTAYVRGPESGRYGFTSALPVQILSLLMPTLAPLLDGPNGSPTGLEQGNRSPSALSRHSLKRHRWGSRTVVLGSGGCWRHRGAPPGNGSPAADAG